MVNKKKVKKVLSFVAMFFTFFFFIDVLNAQTQLSILLDDSFDKTSGYSHTETFMGYQYLYSGILANKHKVGINAYSDYYMYKNNISFEADDAYGILFNYGNGIYSALERLLPAEAIKKDYYTISYIRSYHPTNNEDFDGIYLYLVYYDSPIVFSDLNNLKNLTLMDGSIYDETFVYRFSISNNSLLLNYDEYKILTYEEILSNSNFLFGEDNGIVTSSNFINNSFYNSFYDSNFSISVARSTTWNPPYIVLNVQNNIDNVCFQIVNDIDNKYGLDYFNKYAFSGGSAGIKSFNKVVNYTTALSPPFNGEYGQTVFSNTSVKRYLEYKGNTNKSTIYFQKSLIILYTENGEISLNKGTNAYNCNKDGSDLCSLNLNFDGLEKPGVIIYYDEEFLVEFYHFLKTSFPTVWYNLSDFNLYSTDTTDLDNLICYNCDLLENGNLPNINISNSDLNSYLDVIDFKYSNDVSSLSDFFSRAFNSAENLIDSSIEILSLVTMFFYSLSLEIQALLLLLFFIVAIKIFLRFIS